MQFGRQSFMKPHYPVCQRFHIQKVIWRFFV